jgi:PucR C-terminal helix-turn-helix domain
MANVLGTGTDDAGEVIPWARLAALMRPELPSLAEEIIDAVRAAVPEYARPMSGPYGNALRLGVSQALETFVDQIADPSASRSALDKVCRDLGRQEARVGRSMDSLQTAYRIGTQVAWERAMRLSERIDVSSGTVSKLAASVFEYMNELSELSMAGYNEAIVTPGEVGQKRRRKLLETILERPPVLPDAIVKLAGQAGWPVPDKVTPVALQRPEYRRRSAPYNAALDPDDDMLVQLSGPEPHLLMPGALSAKRRRTLEDALPGYLLVVGLPVPLADAADSLRWARKLLTLIQAGIVDQAPVTLCEDHLTSVLLLSDPVLAEQFARWQLPTLDTLKPVMREWLVETYSVWLDCRCSATVAAKYLRIHPQTVRYRVKRLAEVLGDEITDPSRHFQVQLALHILRLK